MTKPGVKPILNESLSARIRTLYLDGMKYIEIQEVLDINPSTWDTWVNKNYKDFRTDLQNWKHEKLIRKAEVNLDVLMDSEDERVKTTNTHFTLETIGKEKGYSKRTEMTGKDGADLKIVFDSAFSEDEIDITK